MSQTQRLTPPNDVVIHDDIRDQHRIFLEDMFIYLPDSVQAILIAGNMLVLIIALCGNIAAFIIIVKAKLSKTKTKLFLISLALSDFLLVISVIPIELGKLTDKYLSWVFGTFLCEVTAAVQTHAAFMNAICLCGIALERYVSVNRSPKLTKINRRWNIPVSYIALVVTWLLPFCASVPMLWAYEEWSFWVMTFVNGSLARLNNDTNYLCQARTDFPFRAELWGMLAATYFLLLVGFVLCYWSIIKFVKNRGVNFNHTNNTPSSSTSNSNGNNRSNNNNGTSQEPNSSSSSSDSPRGHLTPALAVPKHQHRRTVKLIMALILAYVICRTPVMIFNLVTNIVSTKKTVANTCTMYFLHLLSNVNAAISPFLYAIWNNSLKSAPERPLDSSRMMKNGARHNCCWSVTGRMRSGGSRNIFTNTNSSTSATNTFKTRQNSFSFNTQSKLHTAPSSSSTSTSPALPSTQKLALDTNEKQGSETQSVSTGAERMHEQRSDMAADPPSTTSSTEPIIGSNE